MSGEEDLDRLLGELDPRIRPGEFVFVTAPSSRELPAVATVHEEQGVACVVRKHEADADGLPYDFVAAWITLGVHSSLRAVGLTAAVTRVLADAGISCNILAGYFHDHLLVSHERAAEALELLRGLSDDAAN